VRQNIPICFFYLGNDVTRVSARICSCCLLPSQNCALMVLSPRGGVRDRNHYRANFSVSVSVQYQASRKFSALLHVSFAVLHIEHRLSQNMVSRLLQLPMARRECLSKFNLGLLPEIYFDVKLYKWIFSLVFLAAALLLTLENPYTKSFAKTKGILNDFCPTKTSTLTEIYKRRGNQTFMEVQARYTCTELYQIYSSSNLTTLSNRIIIYMKLSFRLHLQHATKIWPALPESSNIRLNELLSKCWYILIRK
jgi:hypothetical protein